MSGIVADPHSEFRLFLASKALKMSVAFLRTWSVFAVLFVVFDAISIPVMVAWEIPSTDMAAALLPMNFYWTADMVFSAQTGYYDQGVLVKSSRRTLKHYLQTWFFFDLVVVSFDWVMIVLEGASAVGTARVLRAFRMVRIIRLLRLAKLQAIVQVVEESVAMRK